MLKPEPVILRHEMPALIPAVAMHAVRVYHKLKTLARTLEGIDKLESVLVMHIVIDCPVRNLKPDRTVRNTDRITA